MATIDYTGVLLVDKFEKLDNLKTLIPDVKYIRVDTVAGTAVLVLKGGEIRTLSTSTL